LAITECVSVRASGTPRANDSTPKLVGLNVNLPGPIAYTKGFICD